jgi:hypothetical protein
MNQNIWGSHMWFSLHTISLNYPLKPSREDIINYDHFFTSLQNVIPCPICKKNYIRHIQEHPIHNSLDSRKALVYWVIDMHNMVNAEIGKKILSYDTVIKKYEDVYKKKIIINSEGEDDDNLECIKKMDNHNNNDSDYKKEETSAFNYINSKNIVILLFIIFLIVLIVNFLHLVTKTKTK